MHPRIPLSRCGCGDRPGPAHTQLSNIRGRPRATAAARARIRRCVSPPCGPLFSRLATPELAAGHTYARIYIPERKREKEARSNTCSLIPRRVRSARSGPRLHSDPSSLRSEKSRTRRRGKCQLRRWHKGARSAPHRDAAAFAKREDPRRGSSRRSRACFDLYTVYVSGRKVYGMRIWDAIRYSRVPAPSPTAERRLSISPGFAFLFLFFYLLRLCISFSLRSGSNCGIKGTFKRFCFSIAFGERTRLSYPARFITLEPASSFVLLSIMQRLGRSVDGRKGARRRGGRGNDKLPGDNDARATGERGTHDTGGFRVHSGSSRGHGEHQRRKSPGNNRQFVRLLGFRGGQTYVK